MQFTRHTDYALRLLIHLARHDGQARVSIADVAEAQAISNSHLMKIANDLARGGFIEAVRGRNGGIRLARPPEQINLAAVIEAMEPRCGLVDCGSCRLSGSCGLPAVFDRALAAFRAVLAEQTLADVLLDVTVPGTLDF